MYTLHGESERRADSPSLRRVRVRLHKDADVEPGSAEILPEGQVLHVVAAKCEENSLRGQTVHAADPRWLLYVPASQLKQCCPFLPANPALHRQSCDEVLPEPETEFGGHATQSVDPLIDLNEPRSQGVH